MNFSVPPQTYSFKCSLRKLDKHTHSLGSALVVTFYSRSPCLCQEFLTFSSLVSQLVKDKDRIKAISA